MNPREANELVKKHGAKVLSKSSSGREILKKAAEPYKIDLLQPGDPEFRKYWGKTFDSNKLAREQNERRSKEMWAATEERKDFERREKQAEGTDWKSKRL